MPVVASSSRLKEFRANFVTGWYKPEVSAGLYSVRLFTVLNRKSYKELSCLSIRSFLDCLPPIRSASLSLFFFIGKSVGSRDILLPHPLFQLVRIET